MPTWPSHGLLDPFLPLLFSVPQTLEVTMFAYLLKFDKQLCLWWLLSFHFVWFSIAALQYSEEKKKKKLFSLYINLC